MARTSVLYIDYKFMRSIHMTKSNVKIVQLECIDFLLKLSTIHGYCSRYDLSLCYSNITNIRLLTNNF